MRSATRGCARSNPGSILNDNTRMLSYAELYKHNSGR